MQYEYKIYFHKQGCLNNYQHTFTQNFTRSILAIKSFVLTYMSNYDS